MKAARRATRVVVLGGSGFVGSATLYSLASAGYHPVSAHRGPREASDGIEFHPCDATDPAAIARVLKGAAAVVNAVLGNADTLIAATRLVADAAREGLPVVHLSSMAVYGQASGRVSETAKLLGTGSYAEAKIACEAILSGTGAVILRPAIVYGPGGEQWAGRIFRLLRAGRLGDLGEHGDGRCNFVHARDVGAAVVAALVTPGAAGQAINLAHPSAPRWNTVLRAAARAIGAVPLRRISGRRLSAEVMCLAPPLHAAALAARRLKLQLPEAITPSLRALFRQDLSLDGYKARALLGLAHTAPAEGLAECAAWFLQAHGAPYASQPR